MQATHWVEIDLRPPLRNRARKDQIIPHLQSGYIISIGKCFDDGCTETFTEMHITVDKQGQTVPKGHHTGDSGMFQVNLTKNQTHQPIFQ